MARSSRLTRQFDSSRTVVIGLILFGLATAVCVAQPDLAVTKTAGRASVREGDYVIFTVTAVNQGNFPATISTINGPTPAGMTFIAATFVDGSYNESTGNWQPPELDVQDEAKLIFLARVNPGTAGTTITNRASVVTVTPPDSNPANNTALAAVMVEPLPPPDGIDVFPFPESIAGIPLGALGRFFVDTFNGSSNAAVATVDSDLGGVRNLDERLADTNPNDPDSFLAIIDKVYAAAAGVFPLSFQSSPARRYRAQFTPQLDAAFTELVTVDGSGATLSIIHTNATGGFYRLQAELP